MNRRLISCILLFLLVSVFIPEFPEVHATGSEIQSRSCSSTTNSQPCAFSSNVGSGHLLVVTDGQTNAQPNAPTDTLLLTWVSAGTCASNTATSCVWYAYTGTSSGADTVTVTSGTSAVMGVNIYELNGFTATGLAYNTGTGTGTSYALGGGIAFNSGAFVVGNVFAAGGSIGTPAAGTSFAVDAAAGQSARGLGETSVTATSTNTCPSSATTSRVWAEACAAFNLADVEQVTLTISPTGSANQGAVAISGCNPSTTTIAIDGGQHSFTADPSCSLTFTVAADGASTRDRFSLISSTWSYATLSTGTQTTSNTVYHQFLVTNTLGVSGSFPSTGTTQTSTGASLWVDSGGVLTVTPCSFTVQNASFVYQFSPSGVQIYTGAASSVLNDYTVQSVPPPNVQFTETGHVIMCLPSTLTFDKVFVNAVLVSSSLNVPKLYFTGNGGNEVDFMMPRTGGGGPTTSTTTTNSASTQNGPTITPANLGPVVVVAVVLVIAVFAINRKKNDDRKSFNRSKTKADKRRKTF